MHRHFPILFKNTLTQSTGKVLLQRHGREPVTIPAMPVTYVKAKVTTPSHMFAARFKVSLCPFRGFDFGPPHFRNSPKCLRRGFEEKTEEYISICNLSGPDKKAILSDKHKGYKYKIPSCQSTSIF
jgi:hypothetical protein